MIMFPHLTDSKIPFFPAPGPSIRHGARAKYAFATSTSPSIFLALPQIPVPATHQSCAANVVSQHTHRRRLPSRTSVVRKPP